MVPTERLYEIAEAEGIAVEFHRLPRPLLGFYFAEPGIAPAITLSPALEHRPALMRCVFAEELGHHFTSAGDMLFAPYRSYMGRVLLSKAEKRALRWAAEVLIPPIELLRVMGQEGVESLTEHFAVTPTFVRAVFHIPLYARLRERLQEKYGLAVS